MTSSDSASKIISCCFNRSVFDLVNHQNDICRMYSDENPQDFRPLVPCFILRVSNAAFGCRSFFQAGCYFLGSVDF